MKIETRKTHSFIEIKVDEIKTTIFKDSNQEINILIDNLSEVMLELYEMIDKDCFINVCDRD
jgi:hypothetical protein